MFKKILLASDGSSHALRATEKAIALAKLIPDHLIEVVYIVDFNKSKSDVLHVGDSSAIQVERMKRLQETENLLKKADIQYKVSILHGEPGPAIVSHANNHRFDLVIVGSRGLNSLQEMVLGSVSHKVAKRAACPVLIVK
jgi:nucleotide-binding universal stress UspA family protein